MADARRHPKMSRRAAAEIRRRRRSKTVARHPSSDVPPNRRPASPRVKKRRAVIVSVLGALATVGLLFAFVYPTSTFLDQRSEINTAKQRLARIDAQTKKLEDETKRLKGDAEVERIAREQYGFVRPGETPYVIVPATPTTTTPAN